MERGTEMYGINEDAYWEQYQRRHDPQWYDADEDCGEEFGEWEDVDNEVDEMILARGAYED